jgi:tetratricopeptide (TPR) repeat protein
VALACGVLVVVNGSPQSAQPDLVFWTTALERHVPGALDNDVRTIAAWPWRRLNQTLQQIRENGTDANLLLSAMLLFDISAHVPVDERPRLPSTGSAIIAQDGDRRGIGPLDSHLEAARRVLEAVNADRKEAALNRDRIVGWYRAVSAVLAGRLNLADLQPHMRAALERFPEDPGIQFDAGCFTETYASPVVQTPHPARRPNPRQLTAKRMMEELREGPASLLAEAERRFRKAKELDPGFAEARVRLGRVMTLRRRPADAVRELRSALALDSDDEVRYFGHLFLGEALELSKDPAGAMSAFRAAAALFPSAPSPQLAISSLAADQGDTATARQATQRVLALPQKTDADVDPWWLYLRGQGRNADAVYSSFAGRMKQLSLEAAGLWKQRE